MDDKPKPQQQEAFTLPRRWLAEIMLQSMDFGRNRPRSGKVGESCGLPKHITCSITYSIAGKPGEMNAERSHNLVFNQILDGVASMVGNPQHARHTPIVKMTTGGTEHSNSGKNVCADCYLYVNANVSFVMAGSVQYEISSEGIVVCNEEGKFL